MGLKYTRGERERKKDISRDKVRRCKVIEKERVIEKARDRQSYRGIETDKDKWERKKIQWQGQKIIKEIGRDRSKDIQRQRQRYIEIEIKKEIETGRYIEKEIEIGKKDIEAQTEKLIRRQIEVKTHRDRDRGTQRQR